MSIIKESDIPKGLENFADSSDGYLEFPFESQLSFAPFIEYWEKEHQGNSKYAIFAKEFDKMINSSPDLRKPIKITDVHKHIEAIRMMMMTLFPMSADNEALISAALPFSMTSFHSTEKFNKLYEAFGCSLTPQDMQYMSMLKFVSANLVIMEQFYGVEGEEEAPIIFKVQDTESHLDRWYNINLDVRFVTVRAKKAVKKLSKKDINELMNNLYDVDLWKSKVPWDNFVFEGFVVHYMLDVTDQEVLSSIKDDLLEKDAIILQENIDRLEQKLQSFFRISDLRMGIVAINESNGHLKDYGGKIWNSILLKKHEEMSMEDIKGSLIEEMMERNSFVVVKDLKKRKNRTKIEDEMLERGFRNVLLAPLHFDNEPIGILELASPNPGEITTLGAQRVRELVSLFSIASKRSIDELQNQVQAVIKEKYTKIHPAVEWRFVEAATGYLNSVKSGQKPTLDPIVFKDIYPLYGQSDIRSSSVERSKAIQADLIKLLLLAKNVLKQAIAQKQFPIYEELLFQVEEMVQRIRMGLSSGDELNVHEFIVEKLDPLFDHLGASNVEFQNEVQKYRDSLDPDHGFVYEKRKDYEESVSKITQVVSDYIEQEEAIAQQKFPHYFEKYKTDGVEFSIYTGQSLMQDDTFGPLYLQNLRLWQLMLMCEVARKTNRLVDQLKVPLETTHLILVYSAPLSIQFRVDEKQFDVEGAYNIRYEIVKKRIDKAHVKGTNERITQPGKIAIIYSQYKELNEYLKYIKYLQHIGYVTDEVEELEVEELQGVEGLKAVRLTVQMPEDPKKSKSQALFDQIANVDMDKITSISQKKS